MSCKSFVPLFFNTLINSSQAVFYTSRKCDSCVRFCATRSFGHLPQSTDQSIFSVCFVGERNGCEIVQYPQLVVHTDINENETLVICDVLNQLYKCVLDVKLRVDTWKITCIYSFRWISIAVVGFFHDVFVRT